MVVLKLLIKGDGSSRSPANTGLEWTMRSSP